LEERRWPPGRPPLPQDFIDRHKRERYVTAIGELAHERRGVDFKVDEALKRAKMSRTTFYSLFGSGEEALRYACQLAQRRVIETIEAAAAKPAQSGSERLEQTIGALLELAAERPRLVELSLVHSVAVRGMQSGLHDPLVLSALAEVLAEAQEIGPDQRPTSPEFEEFAVGGIVSIIALRLRKDEAESLPALRGELAELAVLKPLSSFDKTIA
jgi:AcrR family transcriptional regulator